ncbi:EAL domain-containing protein [Paraglaciecola chathamensis]|uniref:EAL and HDOD domain-containing protein n=1 Tax=Paraglaciecola chathamensis TaxID=368405 RepID=UPI00270E510B|nr:EAL domain-containing protein [Paraglaciecola chathamensis]MDO6841514.1 EAL domain-containing protein [Paraglaciecola chathamensis]
MFAFIARQPILDRKRDVFAYELLFRDGKNNCFPDTTRDERTEKLIAKHYLTLGLDDISCNKKSFINFQKETLVNGLPDVLDPSNVVVELSDTVLPHDALLDVCRQVKNTGFTIALDDHKLDPKWDDFLPYVDIVKVNVMQSDYDGIAKSMPRLLDSNVKLVAEQIDTQQDFEIYRDMGFDYFQGYFFAKPEAIKQQNLPTSKLTLVELMGVSSSETFDIERVNSVIEHDVGLSYMLLRFVNNPMVNKRYKITSLRHAITYMGEVELKKFVALLALANLNDDKPIELLHLSLVRAKFCDLVARESKKGDNPPVGFLVGLFSLLDAILDQHMDTLLNQLPIDDDVKFALSGGQNDLSIYLVLAKAFESANWLKVIRIAGLLKIDQKRLHSMFNQAIVWGNGLRQSVSPHFPESKV